MSLALGRQQCKRRSLGKLKCDSAADDTRSTGQCFQGHGRIPLRLLRESVHTTNAAGVAIIDTVGPIRQVVEIGAAGSSLSHPTPAEDWVLECKSNGRNLTGPYLRRQL